MKRPHGPAAVLTRWGTRRAVLAAVTLAGLAALWWRGAGTGGADAVALFGPGGRVCGAMSHRGRVLLVATNVRLDETRAWTAETASVGIEDAARLETLLTDVERRGDRWGFLLARHGPDAFSLPGAWGVVVAIPYWPLIALAAVPVGRWWVLRLRTWRRARRGLCLACGYDRRHSPARCPECGWEPRSPSNEAPPAERERVGGGARHHSPGA